MKTSFAETTGRWGIHERSAALLFVAAAALLTVLCCPGFREYEKRFAPQAQRCLHTFACDGAWRLEAPHKRPCRSEI